MGVAVLAVAAAGASLLAQGAGQTRNPTLRLAAARPLVVHGLDFQRVERVRVAARAGETRSVEVVRATRAGSFTATFGAVDYDPCTTSLVVRAIGAAGTTATLKVVPRECPPKP